MKRNFAFWLVVVAFVIFLGKAAMAGVFGNDLLEITPNKELIVRATLGEQVTVRVKVAENIPLPQSQIAATAPVPVAAPVAQAPVNHQPQYQDPAYRPYDRLGFYPKPPPQPQQQITPPVKSAAAPIVSTPAKPTAPVEVTPAPAKPVAPAATAPAKPVAPIVAAPAKPEAPVNREPMAKAEPAPVSGKEVRKLVAMRLPIEKFPKEISINGKMFKVINGDFFEVANGEFRYVGKEAWAVAEEVNGSITPDQIKIMNAPPRGAEIQPFKG